MSEYGPRDEGWSIERAPELSGEQYPDPGVDPRTTQALGATALQGAGVDAPEPEGADPATQREMGATALTGAGVDAPGAAAEDPLPSPEDPQAWAEFTGYQGADATPEPEADAGPQAWSPGESVAIDHGATPEPEAAGASPEPPAPQAEPPAPQAEADEAQAGF